MTSERTEKLAEAMRAQKKKTAEAKAKRRAKRVKQKPWKALRDDWYTCLTYKWGVKAHLPKWTVKEEMLARKLIAEVGFNTSKFAMAKFVESYEKGIPSFGYFWAARATYIGKVTGATSRSSSAKRGEVADEDKIKTDWSW